MADIITESGLSAGAIYLQFDGKADIALGVGHRILTNRIEEVADVMASGELPPPSALLRFMMTGLISEIRDVRMLVQLWGEAVTSDDMSHMVGPIFAKVQEIMRPYLARWAIERRGMTVDSAETWSHQLVPVMLGLGQGFILQSALVPGFDGERYFAGVAQLLDA
ncbi:hypothetical protein BH11ACT3_BH11ACT3_25080 [soil metagenome]